MKIEACDLEVLALSYLDFCEGQPTRSDYLKWCTDNGVEPDEELWTYILVLTATLGEKKKDTLLRGSELVVGKRYWLDTYKDVSGIFLRIDNGDAIFSSIEGNQEWYRKDGEGNVGVMDGDKPNYIAI